MARKLEKNDWFPFLDALSKQLREDGKQAEVEVASLNLGSQIEAEWLPLYGVVYDPKSELIEIALEGVDHMIKNPREVYVESEGIQVTSLEVIDARGVHEIVRLKDPLALPAPRRGGNHPRA